MTTPRVVTVFTWECGQLKSVSWKPALFEHKIMVSSLKWNRRVGGRWRYRWYIRCTGCKDMYISNSDFPPGPDGLKGRKTWAEAFELGVRHQRRMMVK